MNYSAANFTFPWVAISFRRILGTGSCNYSLAWTRLAKQALARSFLISADMAHAWNPAFASSYDDAHAVQVNGGPVIKINANQRYSTEALSEAIFADLCATAKVPVQRYVHRTDLPCGSTIGPITAAALGVRSIDVGNPMWSMHSARESAGAADHGMMIKVMNQLLSQKLPAV